MKKPKPTPQQVEALDLLNAHTRDGHGEPLTFPFDGGKAVTLSDLRTLNDARDASRKEMKEWPASAVFISVDTLVARYESMDEAERVEECHGEHLSGWFEEQGDDEADEEGEFLSTPSHYWPEGTETKAPSLEDYRDALEHCARGDLLAVTP